MNNFNTHNSNPKQAVLPMLIQDYLDICDPVLTFDRVMRGVACLDRWKVDYNILTVVTQDLANHVDEVYSYYAAMGWKYQQYIACLDPVGGTAGHSLKPETYGAFPGRLPSL
jgi:sulfatase maturation enzyme AslB (radical SAM superfamily)